MKSLLLAGLACGLILAPVIALIIRPRAWRPRSWTASAVVLALGLVWTASRGPEAVFGNYLTTRGAYPTVFATTPQVLPSWVLVGLALLGAVGAAAIVGHPVSRPLRMDRNTAVLGLLLTATSFGPSLLGQEVFAGGILPLLPFLVILLARDVSPRGPALSAVLLSALATVALLVTLQAMSFDVARWSFAESLVTAGWPAPAIDAGLEWNGTQARGSFALGGSLAVCPSAGATQQGVTITAEPGDEATIASWPYRAFAVGPEASLFAVAGPACAPAP